METIGAAPGKTGSLVAHDVLILLIFVAAVVGILVAGIVIGLKAKGRRRRERDRKARGEHGSSRHSSSSSGSSGGSAEGSEGGGSGRRRTRRRRRDHRPRNPSLAEAGGLPPERDSDEAGTGTGNGAAA